MSIEHPVGDRVNPGFTDGMGGCLCGGRVVPNDSKRFNRVPRAVPEDHVPYPVFVEEITRQEGRVDEAFVKGQMARGWDLPRAPGGTEAHLWGFPLNEYLAVTQVIDERGQDETPSQLVANLLARIETLEGHTGELRQLREADVAQLGRVTAKLAGAQITHGDLKRSYRTGLALAWQEGRDISSAYHTNPYDNPEGTP